MDEQMLRRALMEANLERFRDVLEGADRDWDWSPRYLRSRTRLLADPFGWAKRMARPVWKRAARAAACAALACLVTLGGLMAVSPTVRAAVLGWLREITENGIFYTALGNRDGAEDHEPPDWMLTDLPEGWALDSASDLGSSAEKQYRCGESWVRFICSYPDEGTIGWGVGDPESGESRREVTVNGYTAGLYGDERRAMLVWQDEDGTLFYFTSAHVDPDALVEMAASAAPEEFEIPAYTPVWLPEGYWAFETTGSGGAAQETTWLSEDGEDSLTLLCAATPLTLPEETPEDVTVNGETAQFWAAEEPREESDSQITVGGELVEGNSVDVGSVTITTGTIAGPQSASAATLAWQSPEGIFFRLHGTESMGTLLRVAASITEATEEQNTTDSFGG